MLLGLVLSLASAQEGQVNLGTVDGTPDYYEIQTGDTLWDISTRFLADPYAWPELWSVNEYITNPHWIYPGNRIYFRLGDNLNPPGAGAPVDNGQPPPQQVGERCDFPPRFEYVYPRATFFAPGTIANPADLELNGTVYGADTGHRMLGERDYVYLKLRKADEVECGQVLAIYRELQRNVKRGKKGNLGRLYRELAVVRILRVDDNIATAQIEQSFYEFERGDLVGQPIAVSFSMEVQPPDPKQELEAAVVARLNTEQILANTGETVFLDRGLNDGVEAGQSMFLVERKEGLAGVGVEDPALPERVVGRVVVVRAEDNWATAVVIDAATPVAVGAQVTTVPNAQ